MYKVSVLQRDFCVDKQLELQDVVIAASGDNFIMKKNKEDFLKYRGEHGITFGIFEENNLIGEAILYNEPIVEKVENSLLGSYLGAEGKEIGGIMINPYYQKKGYARCLINSIKEYTQKKMQTDYFLARINVKNIPSIYSFLKQDGAFIGRTEIGEFPNGSKVLGLNVFFPVNSKNITESCIFLKNNSIDKITFPINDETEYKRFCNLIKSGYVFVNKKGNIEICKPYMQIKEQKKLQNVFGNCKL
jgi:hypothetical protein